MGAVKMTSGLDSRFPMTLERPVHHPLWLLPARGERKTGFIEPVPVLRGCPAASEAAGTTKKPVRKRRKGKKENYSSFDAREGGGGGGQLLLYAAVGVGGGAGGGGDGEAIVEDVGEEI